MPPELSERGFNDLNRCIYARHCLVVVFIGGRDDDDDDDGYKYFCRRRNSPSTHATATVNWVFSRARTRALGGQ